MSLDTNTLALLAKNSVIPLDYMTLLFVCIGVLLIAIFIVFLFIMGWDGNKFSYKLFRRSKGFLAIRIFADNTGDVDFRKKFSADEGGFIDFFTKGKDAITKLPQHLNREHIIRNRKYGMPMVLMLEGEPENSDFRKNQSEEKVSQLNSISKIRAHSLGVLEGMLQALWDKRWLMVIAICAIGAIGVGIAGAYFGYQNSENMKVMAVAIKGIGENVRQLGVQAISNASSGASSGVIIPK